jgi:hypothetical protein
MDTQNSEVQRNGRFSEDDLISLMDDLCVVIGQVLVNFQFLHESILDQAASQQTQEKIQKLQRKLGDERARLRKSRDAAARKRELEKIRGAHEREREKQANRAEQTEGKSAPNMIALKNQKGEVIGWMHVVGKNQIDFLNSKGRLIAREILGRTYNGRGNLAAYDRQGLRVLGQQMGTHHPTCHRTGQTR